MKQRVDDAKVALAKALLDAIDDEQEEDSLQQFADLLTMLLHQATVPSPVVDCVPSTPLSDYEEEEAVDDDDDDEPMDFFELFSTPATDHK